MRILLYIITVLSILGSGFWAYRENYTTDFVVKEVKALRSDVGMLRESIAQHRAELAYLSRPDRLQTLAVFLGDPLMLSPMLPRQMGDVEDLPFAFDSGDQDAAQGRSVEAGQ